jgi:Uncharacterized protein conserved in archaea
MSTYLFMISHPAHFHMFKHVIANLQNKHKIVVVIRPKDVLEQLCINSGLEYVKVEERPQKYGILGLGISLLQKTSAVWKIVKKERPDLLIGSDGVLAHIGFLRGIPSFECYEDDVQVIRLYALLFFPFYANVISPEVTDAGFWTSKKIGYAGYQKMTYLHPNYFTPSKAVVEKYFSNKNPYFLLRFSKLDAHHDTGIRGLNTEVAEHLIATLKQYGDIYITSERKLEPQFEKYKLDINPLDIHHIMAYAKMYIGDSQSMAVEAAMLGIPSVRFSDFAGKVSVLEELEHKYQLTFGIKSDCPDRLYQKVEELLEMDDLNEEFQRRRERMLVDKIDVTAFITWFVENYPESKKIMRENPNYQYKFR